MIRFCLAVVIFLSCSNAIVVDKEDMKTSSDAIIVSDSFIDFNTLNNKIRDGLIEKEEALKKLQAFLPLLKDYYYTRAEKDIKQHKWVFPVQGYNHKTIGGSNGSGYMADGYDYFDGSKHGGHPAHDIFIADKNRDCLDDITNQPVNVLSMTAGIVIATETVWDTTSNLRGGKYIWIYEPNTNSFFYYAHNSKIFIQPCDIVNAGDTIAVIGRTGYNAYKKRSPTHLHIMQLKLDENNYPKPENCYKMLLQNESKRH